MTKTSGMAYITRKIQTTSRIQMEQFIEDSPLKNKDKIFMLDILNGMSLKELEYKYEKSQSRIAQWKRSTFEKLHYYEYAQLRK